MGAFAVMFVGIDLRSLPLMVTGLVVLVVFWHREEIPTTTHGGRQRTEVIWRNHQPTLSAKENYDE